MTQLDLVSLQNLYDSEVARYLKDFPHYVDLHNPDIRNEWLVSMQRGNPLTDCVPWLTISGRLQLDQLLQPGMRVFEWGTGGSTCYFCSKQCEVTGVEHDANWFSKVVNACPAASLTLIKPEVHSEPGDAMDPHDYATANKALLSCRFTAYVKSINKFPDRHFDLVLVDGRSRPSCILHAMPKVKPGGWLVLDNANRERYRIGRLMLSQAGWAGTPYPGAIPYSKKFGITEVWSRPQ